MGKENVTRKLAAILYMDVAGYSRLTGVDEEATHRALGTALDAATSMIESHSGQVLHYAGDAILAEFASVVEAVACAVTVQRDLAGRNHGLAEDRKLLFRIGINLGDVIVDRDELYGEGVNVAARLESLAEAGGICISRKVLDEIRGKLDVGFEFLGEQSVKNIERPIPVYKVLMDPELAGTIIGEAQAAPGKGRLAILLGAVAATVVAGLILWQPWQESAGPPPTESTAPVLSGKPSIAVLPFVNMSGDQEQEYFSDGMTEDLITDLSKISALTVIARTSSFAYKGAGDDVRKIAKELGVRYVVEGSVRKAGGKVRITAQLIDAKTGKHLWADRYDRDFKDIFDLQDEVLEKIVAALSVTLTPVEKKRMARPLTTSAEAYDLYLKGLRQESFFTRDSNLESRKLFEAAIELDPGFASAYARLAQAYDNAVISGWSIDKAGEFKRALTLAEKAVDLDPDYPYGRWSLSRVLSHLNFNDRAFVQMEKAIELNPNYAGAFAYMTYLYIRAGRAEEGLVSIEKAMRMNPRFPFWYYHGLGMAQFALHGFEPAAANLEKALERNPNVTWLRTLLAAAYANMGNQDDAEWQIEELLGRGFSKSIDEILETATLHPPAYKKLYSDGLRKAGLK